MEQVILDIVNGIHDEASKGGTFDENSLAKLLSSYNRKAKASGKRYAKKLLLPYYFKIKLEDPEKWKSWNIDEKTEGQLVSLLRMKPRRTQSGVATITVLTKPNPCSGNCIFCPNDIRMPKSYMSDEPACQRAERSFFDPYLQTIARLRNLYYMGHPIDKVELIILGGTWSEYPESYQRWFVKELLSALNDGVGQTSSDKFAERRGFYESLGIPSTRGECFKHAEGIQSSIDAKQLTYNEAFQELYKQDPAWEAMSGFQEADWDEVEEAQRINERAHSRCVGLVMETRPDSVNSATLTDLRHLGATKLQMGIQSLDEEILWNNGRRISVDVISRSISLMRLFGFKIHIHFMANLLGSDPEKDELDYKKLVSDEAFLPDEVKLYPCALVKNSRLYDHYLKGLWRPYDEDTLVKLLATDVCATPSYIRISRMIRDISAHDIVDGNKKTNLRQMVENHIHDSNLPVREISLREISGEEVSSEDLTLSEVPYKTPVSNEYFLQWVTSEDKIAGFLRLTLPKDSIGIGQIECPLNPGEAMIREVHVYGSAAKIHKTTTGAQHKGLGRHLIERASGIARNAGFDRLKVISAIGTRDYYRHLGFVDDGLYLSLDLIDYEIS
ncbi:MAG: tRNA uridine(34) 5-carboxymethylaminomethyl modification radical SAM/GNAT enzyme Elp3 [Eggerthellaceae bacterium]|nr:tRNA uridine(34) 5-carboxymethylaminomethyl modification radical SAM/GNAT enzyme Elp3 [Eggerthellaceae bacterium]